MSSIYPTTGVTLVKKKKLGMAFFAEQLGEGLELTVSIQRFAK